MKPYFAKYLPVEGEIKQGDKLDSVNGELPGSLHLRLFLCSRDIQVGNRNIFHIPSSTFNVIIANESVLPEKEDPNWIKIIGEISPNAKWVKEGDEFDETQLELSLFDGQFWLKGYDLVNKTNNQWYNPPLYCKAYVQIKCPCCETFK